MKTWRYIRRILTPRWLSDGDGGLVGTSLDVIKDAYAERLELGMLASMPQNGPNGETPPADALAAMGRDRRVVRGIGDTDAQYAVRLLSWLDDRRYAGAAFTLLKQLAGYCGPLPSFRVVDNRGNWYSRTAAGVETYLTAAGNWNWDGNTARWSRFWVIVYPNGHWTDVTNEWTNVATPDYGANLGQWGVTIPREQIASVRSIINDWKPDGTRCVHIIVAFDAASFNPATPEPDGTWGRWGKNSGGARVASRLTTARYLRGSDRA